MLISNTLHNYVKDYAMKDNGTIDEMNEILDVLEKAYVKGEISQYEYRSCLNDLGSTCIKKG